MDINVYLSPSEGQLRLVLSYGLIADFGMILLLVCVVSSEIRGGKKD